MRKAIAAALILFLTAAALQAQVAIEASAGVDRSKAKLGDSIVYTITVKRSGNASNSPGVAPPSFEGFRVAGSYSQNSVNIINNAASMATNLQYELVCIKRGEITIPPAKVRIFNPATGQNEEIETKPVKVYVGTGKKYPVAARPTAAPTTEPDIKEIKVRVAFRFSDLIPYIILAVVFIAAMIVAWHMLFKKKELAPAAEEETDYRKEAQKMLKKARDKLKGGGVKAYYYEIYEAVRYFITMHMKASFEELTTQEIMARLAGLKLAASKREAIALFMSDCDIVKFADYKPVEKEIEDAYKKAGDIIDKT